MRKLILHRQRALAAFAIRYHCFLNRAPQAVVHGASVDSDFSLRNGESVSRKIIEEGGSFRVAAYLESRAVIPDTVIIPHGTDDAEYTIITDFDHYLGLSLRVVPGKV